MKKATVGIIILLITVICIAVAVILTPKEETAANTENSQQNTNYDEAYLEFKRYITSSKELQQDTKYYINQIRYDIVNTFDTLNHETDELLDIIFDNKTADIEEKLKSIKKGDAELSVSYEMFTGMLHTTHQYMSQQEIDYINFLSSVDYYADKEK